MKVVGRIRNVGRPVAMVILAGEDAVDTPTKAAEGRKVGQVFLPARSV